MKKLNKSLKRTIAFVSLIFSIFIVIFSIFILLGLDKYEEIFSQGYSDLTEYAYNNWVAVIVSIGIFSIFSYGFLTPLKKREWKTLGVYEGFIIALFSEMYGFPLTIYVLSSVFGFNLSLSHVAGHLSAVLISEVIFIDLNTAWIFVMVASNVLIIVGILILAKGWKLIHNSNGELVTDGIYQLTRHPQYLGIYFIIFGLLVQWPTIITLIMAPILLFTYYRLAKTEENEAYKNYGSKYEMYKAITPMFIPYIKKLRTNQSSNIYNTE